VALPDGTIITEHNDKEKLTFDTYKERLGTSHSPDMLFDLKHIVQPIAGLEELYVPLLRKKLTW
jgi:hypothetical protein